MNYRPICDVWILARPKVKYYGAYPNGFLERARALLGITPYDALLHVCGGAARDYPAKPRGFGPSDRTLDLDPALMPDYLQGATDPLPQYQGTAYGVARRGDAALRSGLENFLGWPAILADPPYTVADAQQYEPFRAYGDAVFPTPNLILRNMLDAVRPGGKVGMLHYVLPQPPNPYRKHGPSPYKVRFVACVGVIVGYNNRMRTFSVFEREG